jgi:MutS domain V
MTPSEWYRNRATLWTSRRETCSSRALALSRWRLVTFFTGLVLVIVALRAHSLALATLGAGGFIGFAWCVVRHARILLEIDRADAALALAAAGHARLARDWQALAAVPAPADLDLARHPYARDLDIYGHASLTRWLGATATADGSARLARWLLTPAGAADVAARQIAIDELAAKGEWRESFAIEGRLGDAAPGNVARFLEWAEDTTPVAPAFLKPLAIALPLATWVLLAWWFAGAVSRLPPLASDNVGLWFTDAFSNGWWWIPVVFSSGLSRWTHTRIGVVFGRALIGQRVLERHAEMLRLVCEGTWRAPRLAALRSNLRAGGDAPGLVRRLARLGGWSELRSGMPLVYGVVQAFTLWDLHVVFGLERWRAVAGRHVRGWLDALGEIDALAVLSIVRADEPGWTMPSVDPVARDLTVTALGHPLMAVDRRVDNDVTIGPPGTTLFVTGSNMSGKSTLLRSIGLNAVLAQAGAPVCAAAFRMPPADVRTSIHIQDSLELGLSYFMAALGRLKEIVDAAERDAGSDRVLLYLLDEVLQGTNSLERGIAVRAVARHLLEAGAIGAMTSHDLALAAEEPIKSAGVLVHFTELVREDGTMTFDYRLRPGLATSRNAIRLMQLIGITPE